MKRDEKKMIGAETQAMATLLGRLDCTFWPAFAVDGRNRTVMFERQQTWLAGVGLPVTSNNSNPNERKQVEFLWKLLERAGLVTIARRKGRRSHIRFTATGETFARALCGTGDVFCYREEFEQLVALCDETGKSSLPMSFVADVEPWENSPEGGKALYMQTSRILPHVTAGHATFTLDTLGGLWIGITAAGREAVDNPPIEPDGIDEWTLIEEASDVYEAAFRAAKQELAIEKPDHPHNFILPRVPAGWGCFREHLAAQRERELERQADVLD